MEAERAASRDGLILLDKPSKMTSHDCVDELRKLLPRKFKVGHGGTLDPFCTGLLILLLGKGTRLSALFQKMDKSYEGIIRFGTATDSFDCDGKVTETGPLPRLDAAGWQEAANKFVGPQLQVPPAFSAKRLGNRRAYELAREGIAVELQPVSVQIFDFTVEPVSESDLHFLLRCSSGTYVRAIARDLGALVQSPAYCLELRRTAVGPFVAKDANQLNDPFRPPGFMGFDDVDLGFPVHRANYREERLLFNGQNIPAPPQPLPQGQILKVVGPSERFIAIGKISGRQIHPETVFPG